MTALRRWLFRVEDWDDHEYTIGPDGDEADAYDSEPWIGTQAGAMAEADRRADLWESRTGGLVARVVSDSMGIVIEAKTQ